MTTKPGNVIPLNDETLPIIEQFANQMPGGFFIYRADESESIIYVNEAMTEIFGCESAEEFKELTGNTFRGMVHPDDLEEVESSILSQIEKNTNNRDYVEYRIIRKDGSVRYIEDYGHFVKTDNYGGVYYVFINDATEKHIAEELEKQRKLSSFKLGFLFNISHDIRTPMNSIMGFTALAKCHINEPGLLSGYLDKVDMSNRHMMSLIDDILEMSSIESGNVRIADEARDISSIVKSAAVMLQPEAGKKGVALYCDTDLPDVKAYTDAARLERVLTNVIGNAVKFTPGGGSVRLTARSYPTEEAKRRRYEFTVTDNGIGMSEEFLTRIFSPFEREETSTKTGYPGSGLGLSIASSLLRLMGGTISVSSKKGEGSEFVISVPMKISEAPAVPKPAASDEKPQAAKSGARVLIVEDIEINRLLAELKRSGFEVSSVNDGCDAVEAVRNSPEGYFDAVLMDIQMPIMNGYEATRAIRALEREDARSLPIIALSANAAAEDRRMSLESGMNTHIAKPFEINELINTINSYLL